ncbi:MULTISPECIES: polyamine ABC transporter substrate-binding protein [unclassified Methylobacterium]|nr:MULTISPECIES: polyamine ABC transporter substrate-binding protein [unclassified Methylobacterium]PIU05605.1 MAG: spermidine/putrescine ABC transporter substrate-binding protein PotF [Methylobacterium sp. CG09_land_8_20_14_0_10_71_15]PIU14780.1 MAG: spermidine/putrescine ABC transporter substrate-binding protein PotF [Methylobacterium sp. CG08_land_8_20_14_0_20_71_15]GBU18438.1 putrescine ABC transporter periplasmic binding protein [Methylobacterium sp.]
MRPRLLRLLRAALAAAALALSGVAAAAQAERVVNIYNWSDYIDPKVLEAFTRETGIKVVYDTYDNNEILETKLLAGRSGYDVVAPSGPFLQRLIKAGAFQPLDKGRLKNLGNVWPEIANRLAVYDPGNLYAVDYMWGTTGIGVNLDAVRERLGPLQALNTWNLVLSPALLNKLKDCGVMMLDSPEDLIPSLLPAYGLKSDSKRWDDITQVTDALFKLRGAVRKFHSSEYIQALANGDICLAVGYSGDVIQARRRAVEAKNDVRIGYLIPKEGTLMWFDAFAIPKDAPHKDEAHVFIDYMLRPEVAAANTNFVSYASGNLPAKKLVKPEILSDPGIYPDEVTMQRLSTNTAWDDRTQRFVTRAWTRVRTGR